MNNYNLSDNEISIIEKCLKVSVEGDYFDDNEFSTIIGLSRDEINNIYNTWPKINGDDKETFEAIKSCMLNLRGYPHGKKDILYKDLDTDKISLDALYEKVKNIINII